MIHTLLTKVGNITDEAYRKQVAVYRKSDGSPCVDPATGKGTSKLLSKDQGSHLIDRLQAKADRQEERAAAGVDIAALPKAESTPKLEELLPLVAEEDDIALGSTWLYSLWGIDAMWALDKTESETAVQLLLAYKLGPEQYDKAVADARAQGRCR